MTSLADLARAARGFAALERCLFEVLGGWVPRVPEPEVKLVLRAHSFEHAWHAELWDGIAPRTGPQAGVGGIDAELSNVLLGVSETASTAERLQAAYGEVLPRLVGAYRDLRDGAAPASDGPLVRVLRLMLADDEPALATGQLLHNGVMGTPVRQVRSPEGTAPGVSAAAGAREKH